MNTYSLKKCCEIIGEKPKRIQYWILQRVFEPSDPGSGTGTMRKFSFENLLEISIASMLSNAIFNIGVIRHLVKQVHREAPEFFAEDAGNIHVVLAIQFITKNSQVTNVFDRKKEPEAIDKLLSEEMPVTFLNLHSLKAKLLEKIKSGQ